MLRYTSILLALVPLAVLAQLGEPKSEGHQFKYTLDRKYECRAKQSVDSAPHIFIETYLTSDSDMPAKYRFAIVNMDETEYDGVAYQDGSNYRVEFSTQLENLYSQGRLEYSIFIRADGEAAYFDFSDVEPGEKTPPDQLLICKRTQ